MPIYLRIPIVVFALAAIISLSNRESNECDMTFTAYDSSALESRVVDYLKERESELYLLGLHEDASDLEVSIIRSSEVEPIPRSERDHPMDYATVFLYADVNGYSYRFAFDDCGKVLSETNLSGFNFDFDEL